MANENEAPFVFGVRVEGNTFTDRKEETNRLKMNFLYGVNTILISPRRMGKTSLVEKVCSLVESDTLKIAKIDAFGCRSENDFINAFATAVVRATSSKWEEWMENAKTFLSRFIPKISIGQDPLTDFSIALEYNRANTVTEDILQLPETIAKQKGIKIVICIDEFQQIADFPDSITFQKKLRSVWQLQSNVSYCLYGSKKHMMEKMFQSQSHPFYRFGDLFYLDKISETDWVEYICERFRVTGKEISRELASEICTVTDRYSSYVQQLAWLVWLRTDKHATKEDVEFGIDRMLDACEPLFIQQTESLSAYQMNFLRALANGVHTGFTRSEILDTYQLGTAANISRLKKALTEKDLIMMTAPKKLEISDPILALWLKRRVWKS
ncbi:MAG: ATP-binding protein [Bacteroidales bacterium]|nr:ATP-binding protein [Bacteroidales bacterium]